jgi:hypothetical protein
MIGFLIMYSVVSIPYYIGFSVVPTSEGESYESFITFMFGLDMIVNFNTAYYDTTNEYLVVRRRHIARNYLKFWFWVDLISTLPFRWMIVGERKTLELALLRVVRIIRLIRLLKLYHVFKRSKIMDRLYINPAWLNLGLLLMIIFYIAHLFACFWHFIADDNSFMFSWINNFGFTDTTISERYVASFYYVIITMISIGYGDIYPTNSLERFYAIITMLTGVIIVSALVGRVNTVIANRNPRATALKEKIVELKSYFSQIRLPEDLQQKTKVS